MSETQHVFVAIGDVHGERERLAALHDSVFEHLDLLYPQAHATLVHLGDYVDRGPDSCGAIADLMALEARARDEERLSVVNLMGNHEQMMIGAIVEPGGEMGVTWVRNGGIETLQSYERRAPGKEGREAIDPEHVNWLAALPTIHLEPDHGLAFVHAGIDPKTFPECGDEVRLWTRSKRFFDSRRWPRRQALQGLKVVHGHTPTRDSRPQIAKRRINIDTGAVYGGPLTAVILNGDEKPVFLTA